MATPDGNFIIDGDSGFPLGMNSDSDPVQLVPGQFARGENILIRGKTIQVRPGYNCLFALPEGNLQGFALFRPKQGLDALVFAVDGVLYSSEAPFSEYRAITEEVFPPEVRQVYFAQTEQAVEQNPDGSLSLISPRNLLIIQDGGRSPAVVFDGSTATRNVNIPSGGAMIWIGDRLWVANRALLYASDLNNPLSFVEDQYLATVRAFVFPAEITALASTPTVSLAQLIVFTDQSTSMIQAGIRNRAAWPTTPDMQREIFSTIGCKSQRSVVVGHGLLWWYSSYGLTSFDAAQTAQITNRLPYKDNEMMESKSRLSEDLSGIASASFENFLLVSVPYSDLHNRHTWVLDASVNQNLIQDSPAVWSSFWTGTRPVQWVSVEQNGKTRLFYISPDFDGTNRLWEAFSPNREDEDCPISWYVETRAYVGDDRLALRDKTFRFADIFLSELMGDVDIGVFWAGSHRGRYKQIFSKRIKATEGCFFPELQIDSSTQIFAYKKQSRVIRTEDVMTKEAEDSLSSCQVERPWGEQYDDAFQLLICGSGQGAIRALKLYMEPPSSRDDRLKSDSCEDETEANVVRFDGGASEMDDAAEAHAQLSEGVLEFTSIQSASVSSGGLTEVATGTGRSIISQEDADKIALAVATRKAAHDLEDRLPRIVSLGEAANQ